MSRRHRIAEAVANAPFEPGPLIDATTRARIETIRTVRVPEPYDAVWLIEQLDRLDRGAAGRDRESYERGRVDERVYWRARQQLAGTGLGLLPVPAAFRVMTLILVGMLLAGVLAVLVR